LDNARQKLKEKKVGLKKTEQSYKKDEAAFETLKKAIAKLEVRWVIGIYDIKESLEICYETCLVHLPLSTS